ncbi:MAG: hypothetical protein HY313_06255 [Acidobacteria bacterium]|nr:hypothetical protein [Acidobacteriota bacterium]
MPKKKDTDLQQVMAEEKSRGSRRPVKAVNLEIKRRIQRVARMLADKNCQERDYFSVLREDFGLKDGSAEFLEYVKAWDLARGKF